MITLPDSYPKEYVLEDRVNDVDVTLLGVVHTPNFWRMNEDFFKAGIAECGAIISECSPDDLKSPIITQNGARFFGAVIGEAAKNGKAVYKVDPLNIENLNMQLIDGTTQYAGIAAAIISEIAALKAMLNNQLTRRKFIKLGIMGTLGVFLGKDIFYDGFSRESHLSYGIDDALAYNRNNFRELCVAAGIDKLTKQWMESGPLLCIHGAYHTHPIHHYLNNSRVKRRIYPLLEKAGDSKIRQYRHDGTEWKLAMEEKY